MNYILRKAAKDYVCECCGRIIHKGEQYIDKIIVNNGNFVKHIRYHDECPTHKTIVDKVYDTLRTGVLVPAIYRNTKWNITGIVLVGNSLFFSLLSRTSDTEKAMIETTVDANSKDLKVILDEELF